MTDEDMVREALKVLEGMTSNCGDDQFVWASQEAFDRALKAAEARGFDRGYREADRDWRVRQINPTE